MVWLKISDSSPHSQMPVSVTTKRARSDATDSNSIRQLFGSRVGL